MKTLSIILIVAGGLMYSSTSKANITALQFQDDGDTAVDCPLYVWNGTPNSDVTVPVDGTQYSGPGHINGTGTTDSATDPSLTLNSVIDNETSAPWTAYNVNVFMNSVFTLSGVSVTLPSGWTVANIVQPFSVVGNPHGTYEGQIQMVGGTPVTVGNGLVFAYTLNFSDNTAFTFTQEMVPVPEPGTFGFLAAGVLLLGGFLIVSRRKSHS